RRRPTPAPSSCAASRCSSGIAPSPARYIAIANPVSCQAAAMTIGISATGTPNAILINPPLGVLSAPNTVGSVVHPGGSETPTDVSSLFTPVLGLKIHRHTTPVTMNDNA